LLAGCPDGSKRKYTCRPNADVDATKKLAAAIADVAAAIQAVYPTVLDARLIIIDLPSGPMAVPVMIEGVSWAGNN
jgi:hypothetical protein